MSFVKVQAKIAKTEGVPMARAGAMLASATRRAGPKARRKNPALNKVKGKAMPMKPFAFSGIMGDKK